MKFGEALSEGLVNEWQDQYVNYKEGKKLIKKIRSLKDEYDELKSTGDFTFQSKNSGTNDDRTPLLSPIDGGGGSRGYGQENEQGTFATDTEHSHSYNYSSQQLRPSIFNYSLRSSSRKDDYLAEKRKFQQWLDSELLKVDEFYSEREQLVYERFLLLQDQLYQLRDQRTQLIQTRNLHDHRSHNPLSLNGNGNGNGNGDHASVSYNVNELAFHTKFFLSELNRYELPSLPSMTFLKRLMRRKRSNKHDVEDEISLNVQDETDLNYAENRVRNGIVDLTDRPGDDQTSFDSESDFEAIPAPSPRVSTPESQTESQSRQSRRRDYTIKKKRHFGVPYLYAKKQLKAALLEHYRSLSILESYKIMNRTAFRKITKKYDKAMSTNIMEPFMNKIDTTSYFLTSDLLSKLIIQVEELFITFFDSGSSDRKHALEKLKTITYTINASEMKQPSYYSEFFSSGTLIGFGIPLFVLGLYTGLYKTLNGDLPEGRYILQIWGGFFLLTLMFLLFGINMVVFEKFRINYKFIFEFDLATALNYKQYWLLPSFAFAFLSLIAWFSFSDFWPRKFPGRDWPWIFFGVMIVIFMWPTNAFYGPSRRWLQFALWRLLLSGLYPVEFRDFFLGDIVCSLTYTMGNLSFFFCMYAHHWRGTLAGQNPDRNTCTSSKSHLMGFFAALPSVWRLLQCIRRYMDTADWFPHLANMMKYTCSTIYYMTLSLYRIDRSLNKKVTFIMFASINSVYCSIWDIVMDWSLLQMGSKNFLLRDYLFYKNKYYYYAAMIIDVILRFQWIFYAFFGDQIQQSAVTSFCVALAEILRRFIWVFFRMENEHCTNVILFRASKETPLPYAVSAKVEKAVKRLVELRYRAQKYHVEEGTDAGAGAGAGAGGEETTEESVGYTTAHAESRGDDIGSIDLSRMSIPSGPQLQQRKTYFKQFTDRLNTAHIKDFQRRKTAIHHHAEDSDEDDEDDEASISAKTNSRNSQESYPRQDEEA
ncbi:SYG1 [Candida oxycetoniae]|uniref:SYG1 n=1 Tax=Candida oxycetoniae TaxID=497107 RepID=A0AAI9T110_9ASCO|nr:SYG1 [Candida oxycetoniae]KAI3406359.2 SYG1 [Candida oxycetoniae]